MTTAERLTTIAENQQRVYDAGYGKGYSDGSASGGGGGYDDGVAQGKAELFNGITAFYQLFAQGYNDGLREYAFSGADLSKITNWQYAFSANKKITEFRAPETMQALSPQYMLDGCTSLVRVSGLERGIVGTVLTGLFYGCTALVDCGTLNFDGVAYTTKTFQNCTALQELRVVGTIAVTLDLQYSPLSKDSILSVLNALSTTKTGVTVTFKKSAVDAAFTTDEWNAEIAKKTNWTYALV